MTARVVSGSANPSLAGAVAAGLGTEPVPCQLDRFPDGELRPAVGHVRGDDVYVVQPTSPPVNDHVVELLLLVDACRRAGAGRVTAVVPYFGYARQDRRGRTGEAVAARVVTAALAASGAHRLVVVDPHTAALEAMSELPVEMLTAAPLLAAEVAAGLPEEAVVVAPDLGAVKLAERFAARLGRSVAVVSKLRLSGADVRAQRVVGDVAGRPAVIVDDMISTGATVEAAAAALVAHGALPEPLVAATHGPLVPSAEVVLRRLPVHAAVITDTVMADPGPGRPFRVRSVAPLLADAIRRLHDDRPLDDLLLRG